MLGWIENMLTPAQACLNEICTESDGRFKHGGKIQRFNSLFTLSDLLNPQSQTFFLKLLFIMVIVTLILFVICFLARCVHSGVCF